MKRLLILTLLISQIVGSIPIATYLKEITGVKYEKEITNELDEENKIILRTKSDFVRPILSCTKSFSNCLTALHFYESPLSAKPLFSSKDLIRWYCIFRI